MTNPEPKPAAYVIRRDIAAANETTSYVYWLHNPNPCFPGRWVPQSSRATRYQSGRDIDSALSAIPREEATGARVVRLKPKAKPHSQPNPRSGTGSAATSPCIRTLWAAVRSTCGSVVPSTSAGSPARWTLDAPRTCSARTSTLPWTGTTLATGTDACRDARPPPRVRHPDGMTDGPKPWYDLREYAAMTGQTYVAVRRQADRGTLKTSRYGGRHGKRIVLLATLITDHADLYASLVAAMTLRHSKK